MNPERFESVLQSPIGPLCIQADRQALRGVFLLPAGAYCRIKRKVWHMAPFALGDKRLHGIVILPPYTYTHDCFVFPLDEEITF